MRKCFWRDAKNCDRDSRYPHNPSILAFELGEVFVAADAGFAELAIDGGNFLVQRQNLAFGCLGVLHQHPALKLAQFGDARGHDGDPVFGGHGGGRKSHFDAHGVRDERKTVKSEVTPALMGNPFSHDRKFRFTVFGLDNS